MQEITLHFCRVIPKVKCRVEVCCLWGIEDGAEAEPGLKRMCLPCRVWLMAPQACSSRGNKIWGHKSGLILGFWQVFRSSSMSFSKVAKPKDLSLSSNSSFADTFTAIDLSQIECPFFKGIWNIAFLCEKLLIPCLCMGNFKSFDCTKHWCQTAEPCISSGMCQFQLPDDTKARFSACVSKETLCFI